MMSQFTSVFAGGGRFAAMAMIFLSVVTVTLILGQVTIDRFAVRRRLAAMEAGHAGEGGAVNSLRAGQSHGLWVRALQAIEARGLPLVDTNASLVGKLAEAGYAGSEAQKIFTLIRLILTLGLPILFVSICFATGRVPSIFKLYMISTVLGLVGLYLPKMFLSIKADRRRSAITNGFPDVLDLMLVCVEAGLGVDAAFNRVGAEIRVSHPLLSELLGMLSLELRAGRGKADALHRFANRAGVEEIRQFATLVVQSEKLGTSIAQTLRIFSAEMREKRRLRAEEKAHRLPVIISIPLVACLLPAMIGVLMLPAVIRVMRVIVPALEQAH